MINKTTKALYFIAILLLFKIFEVNAANTDFCAFYDLSSRQSSVPYEPWRIVGSKVPWPKNDVPTLVEEQVAEQQKSPTSTAIIHPLVLADEWKMPKGRRKKISVMLETDSIQIPERFVLPSASVDKEPIHHVVSLSVQNEVLGKADEEDDASAHYDTAIAEGFSLNDIESSDDEETPILPKAKTKKRNKGKPKNSSPAHATMAATPVVEIAPIAIPPLHPLTNTYCPTFNVKFIYADFGNLDKGDKASGFASVILYQLDLNSKIIKRLTDARGLHLFKIYRNDHVEELTQADRILSLKGRNLDFLFRNGNELYSLYEEGISDIIEEEELQDIAQEIVQYLQALSLPPYRQLSISEVKRQFPTEKKCIGNTYFLLQPSEGETVVVRTRQNNCWAMTTPLTSAQQSVFDAFNDFYDLCPIGLVRTQDDMTFVGNAANFDFG